MRCDQPMGLPIEAITFLRENEIPEKMCQSCKRPYPRKLEKIDKFIGMFGDVYPLHRHQLKNGGYADEFLQATPWSSGPCFFLGLRIYEPLETAVFTWSQSAIDSA